MFEQTTCSPALTKVEIAVIAGHPGGEGARPGAALEHGEVLLERGAGRILRARVLVALVLAERLLDVGRGLVDRDGDGARRGIRLVARVDAVGRESPWLAPHPIRPRGREDPLVRIALRAVREERDDRLAGPEALGDAQRGRGGGARGAADEKAFLARELAARVEGLLVADLDHLVDERPVEDSGQMESPMPSTSCGPGAPPPRIEPCGSTATRRSPGRARAG